MGKTTWEEEALLDLVEQRTKEVEFFRRSISFYTSKDFTTWRRIMRCDITGDLPYFKRRQQSSLSSINLCCSFVFLMVF
ncbi:hypothetical protein RND71_029438 [Anisodus tanguticus]|uniref:Uncharacterized protein n=1 Tax=Anisodus tanguticus TaxID=243964 RepID=A0AAE1V781_9SOLA|nr:hypothetical protein RND71_029438 [Anisodus tanguticus]